MWVKHSNIFVTDGKSSVLSLPLALGADRPAWHRRKTGEEFNDEAIS